jgi:hypothetical protein
MYHEYIYKRGDVTPRILTIEVEKDGVYKFQIFVQVRITYIGGFLGKVLAGKKS